MTFTPGLYKIFDEIVVNAADNKQRDPTMNRIEVTIDPSQNSIRVWNNGKGIPVAIHQEHQIYVPELIFGHLLTGSNFDDEESKTTGGRNGYGAKLANIFSSKFIVETADSSTGQKFKQVYENNMGSRTKPEVAKHSGADYTCITFYPDLKRFKMDFMDEDTVALLSKRVYDIAGTNTAAGTKLSVYLNGTAIMARNFEQYVSLYKGLEVPCAFERVNDRWEIGVGVSDGTFQQVSFVNSISTTKGGTHVNYIADQISSKLMAVVKKRNKGQEVKAHQIKGHLAIYVNALIVNPAFDSQTKENLTTKHQSFGSTCVVSEKLLKQIEKSGIIDNILSWAKFKQNAELKKKSGSKRSKLIGITKLDDANCAGTAKSKDCTLILTEGDSAKALAISGLGVVGRDYYGVFPLKGKLLNVREAAHAQMMKNEEVQNIVKILGLTFGRVYEDVKDLRYGHLMIMTDQDHDGSHIKGLLINFIHHFWPSLLKIDGFLQQFITPIVKCTKGKKEETFFTIPEYNNWKEANEDGRGWKIKYYKGLGTSTAAEAKEYFSHLETHEINFAWDPRADDVIDMAFAKKRVDDRKLWLLSMEPGVHIDYNVDSITYDSFVNKELILFSHADNERSIPHFMDGLKPSQRKVLFACFKRNLKQEIKVAQLAGYISEHSAYHHGEASLTQTIISMAQNFVGSNNINLLSPCGQFGTRLMGGKDAASPRYVFTKLEAITRCIFHPHDDPLLNYLDDDGQSIEPTCYVPVIPMVLVNGSDGIGTGWSSGVPTYNPREIIDNLRKMIAGEEPTEMIPWFRGFTGEVQPRTYNSFTVSGIIEADEEDGIVVISELPVNKWTTDYKQMLEMMIIGNTEKAADGTSVAASTQIIKDFKENHTDTTVLFTINVPKEKLSEVLRERNGLEKRFKIDGSVCSSNMNMFDMNAMIHKFDSTCEVMRKFFDIRIEFYEKRKDYLAGKLTEEFEKLDNKVKFIVAVCTGKLVVSNRKKEELLKELKSTSFKAFFDKKAKKEDDDDDDDEADQVQSTTNLDKGYDYLLSMKIWSLTMEKVQALTAQRDEKKAELDLLLGKVPEDLWLEDLDALEAALEVFEGEIDEAKKQEGKARRVAGAARTAKQSGKPKSKAKKSSYGSNDESEDESESDFSEDEKPRKKAPVKSAAPAPKAIAKPAATASAMSIKKPAVASVAAAIPKPASMVAAKPQSPPKVLSLAERLAAIKAGGLAIASSFSAPAAPIPKAAAPKAPTAAKKPVVLDMMTEEIKPARQPARNATKKAIVYDIGSDEDDEDEEEDEDDDESFDSDDDKPKKKAAAKVPTSKAKAPPKAVAAPTVKAAGVKRPTKSATASSAKEVFSPGDNNSAGKKARPSSAVKQAPSKAAPKPAAAAAKKPAAKAPVKKRVVDSDSEEELEDTDEDDVVFVKTTPKPSRARKPTNFATFFADDEDEEDEEGDEDEEDEESDAYESD